MPVSNFAKHDPHRKPYPVVERKGERRPIKVRPKKWSHQHDLDALVGKKIRIQFRNGDVETGELVAADQYALKLACSDQSAMTYFKSDMRGYKIAE